MNSNSSEMGKRDQVLEPVFLISLFILLVNDFYLKQAFSDQLTGKLSDFAGLIVFPVFFAYLIPGSKKWISVTTAVLFIIWKTPIVTPLIDLFNQSFPIRIQRVIDYTDYWALLVLPLAHVIINKEIKKEVSSKYILKISKAGLALLSFFAICATTLPPPVEMPGGTIYIGKDYTIKKSKEQTIQLIKSLGYNVDYYENREDSTTTIKYGPGKRPYYQTDNIVIYDDDSKPVDTILNIKYTLYRLKEDKTRIDIINVTLSKDGNIQRWQTLKYLRKRYKNALEKQIIKKVK